MILILLDTGIRVAELASLKRTDINIDTRAVRIIGKGDKERIVGVSLPTRQALLAYTRKRTDNHDALWVSEERRPMTTEGIKTTIQKISQYAKIEGDKTGPHTYRHTAARRYLMNGGDLRTLQYMMGHADIATAQIYLSDISDVDMFKVHEKVSPVENLLQTTKRRVIRV
jgi:site-specific recombinase XerD